MVQLHYTYDEITVTKKASSGAITSLNVTNNYLYFIIIYFTLVLNFTAFVFCPNVLFSLYCDALAKMFLKRSIKPLK